jgi:hypothetical protein
MCWNFNLVSEYEFSLCVQIVQLTIGEYESKLIAITLLHWVESPGQTRIHVYDACLYSWFGTTHISTESFDYCICKSLSYYVTMRQSGRRSLPWCSAVRPTLITNFWVPQRLGFTRTTIFILFTSSCYTPVRVNIVAFQITCIVLHSYMEVLKLTVQFERRVYYRELDNSVWYYGKLIH